MEITHNILFAAYAGVLLLLTAFAIHFSDKIARGK